MTDTHAHIDDPAFDPDREEVLEKCREAGVARIINAGSSPESLGHILDLTREYDFIYAAIGIHPEFAGFTPSARDEGGTPAHKETAEDKRFEVNELLAEKVSRIVSDPLLNQKIVSVGEIGLDYHYDDAESPEVQEDLFKRQIEIAKKAGLPIEVHSRDACADTLRVLRETNAGDTGCDMHCYGYSKEAAREYLELGCYLGIGGVSTFKNGRKLKEVIEYAPLDRLLLETDCPYLAPEPHRGKRNAPYMLPLVVSAIAQIKGISEEKAEEATTLNAKRLFPKLYAQTHT